MIGTVRSVRLVALCLAACALLCGSLARAAEAIIATQLEPPILDPTANPAAAISECLYGNIYEGLVQFAPDGTVLPRLAQSWEISADGLTYTFHLIKNARFHDGVAFDAAAAKFTLDRVIAPGSVNAQRSQLKAIRSVEVVDPYTLRLNLSRRSGGLLQSLALQAFIMVSPRSADGNATHPVGTGPFLFESWRRGDSLSLIKNPGYRGPPAGLDRVTFKFIAEPTAAYAALMAGDVDAFSNYPAPESFAQFAADPRFAVFNGSTEMEVILSLNERVPALANLKVRRAIAYALDRRAIIDGAMYGYGIPIGSHFPPQNPAYLDLTGRYPFDLDKARALLAKAGYTHGLTLSLKLPPPSYARRSGEIVAAQLARVGIHLKIENLEWAQWLNQVYAHHDFDTTVIGHAEPLDYDIYARDNYYFGYSSPKFNALIAALDDTVQPELRKKLLQDIQRMLADDAVNGFLFQFPRLDVWNRHLLGIGFNNDLGTVDLANAHYDSLEFARLDTGMGKALGSSRALVLAGVVAMLAGWVIMLAARQFGAAYIARRAVILLLTLFAASLVVFFVVQVVPGDPVRYMMGLQADPDAIAAMRHQLGLDASAGSRYISWLAGLLHADFGVSYTYRVPVSTLVAERLQLSLPLALFALLLASAMAFPAGIIAAARRGRPADSAVNAVTQLGLALPNFWLGMLLVLLFAVSLHWISAGGFPGWNAGFWPAIRALLLPAVALATPQAAILARVLRGALIDTLHEDYIRTARAKGASEWYILWHHALPNAWVPVLTILGMQFSFLLAGGVIIENVFFLPGLGRLVFQAIVQRDLIVVQSVVVILVFAVVSVSFLVELAYALVNPQLREASEA